MNSGSTYIAIELYNKQNKLLCYNNLINMKSAECQYSNVLNLFSSDQQLSVEVQGRAQLNLINIQNKIEIKSFGQVGVQLQLGGAQNICYPVAIIHESSNSVILLCQKYKNLEQQPKLFVIKISPLAQYQSLILHKLMDHTKSKNIVRMIDQKNNIIILQKYEGSLRDILINNEILNTQFICKLLRDCVEGLKAMEQIGLVHSDIKPDNILYQGRTQSQLQFCICDFGSCIATGKQNKDKLVCQQSWAYRGPQWLAQNPCIDSKLDVWGIGCVIFECLTGESLLPLDIESQSQYLQALHLYASPQQINRRMQRFTVKSQAQLTKLVNCMLEPNVSERASLMEASAAASLLLKSLQL